MLATSYYRSSTEVPRSVHEHPLSRAGRRLKDIKGGDQRSRPFAPRYSAKSGLKIFQSMMGAMHTLLILIAGQNCSIPPALPRSSIDFQAFLLVFHYFQNIGAFPILFLLIIIIQALPMIAFQIEPHERPLS